MTRWPPFLGPGWLMAYAIGLLCLFAIYELWGACVVLVLLALGTIGIIATAEALGHEHVTPAEDPLSGYPKNGVDE